MTLIYDEQLPVLDDSFQGDEVSLLATRGRTVDRNFRRSYAWAKYAADRGALKKINVYVETDGTNVEHSVAAVQSALTGARLHDSAVFDVVPGNRYQVELAEAIAARLVAFAAPVKPKPAAAPAAKQVSADANLGLNVVSNKQADVKPAEDKKGNS